jgi:hypothetical protein
MDAKSRDHDDKAAEARRQESTHERAIASIGVEQRRQEAAGYALLAAAAAFGELVGPGRWLRHAATAAKLACIGMMTVVIPLYLLWTVTPGG